MDESHQAIQRTLEVPFPPKPPIRCLHSAKHADDLSRSKTNLIFTHGAGGTLEADAVVNFTQGFISNNRRPSLLAFQGNINLTSRVKMFSAILEAHEDSLKEELQVSPAHLGGRSMGARAAIKAATDGTTHLVLVSYPLHTGTEVRDQILLQLPIPIKVLFVSGDRDEMCDLKRLESVRMQMKCQTWRIVVQGADHGMNVKPKSATQEVGRMTGDLVATWLDSCDENVTEGTIFWDPADSVAKWSGWYKAKEVSKAPEDDATKTGKAALSPIGIAARSSKRKTRKPLKSETEAPKPETKRRRKR